jgi:hypothetical protein
MISVLTYRKLIPYVDGRAQKPKVPNANAMNDIKQKFDNKLKMWEIRNKHAHLILSSMLPEMYQIKIIGQETATGTWKIISSKFGNQSVIVQIDLLQQMNQLQCIEDTDPCQTIQMLQVLQAKYASAGGHLHSPQFTAIILSMVLEKYCPLLHALIATTCANGQKLNPNNLISHITKAAKHKQRRMMLP